MRNGQHLQRSVFILEWPSLRFITNRTTPVSLDDEVLNDRKVVNRFIGLEKPPSIVRLTAKKLPMVSQADLEGERRGWVYDSASRVVSVRIRDLTKEERIVLE